MAAIAYLGWQAPQLLPLKKGDVLVVNASDAALLTHSTSPEALRAYVDDSVHVFSVPNLHAKVLVTATKAVIGSANASTHSGELEETIAVTDEPAARKALLDFIRGLAATATPVDEQFLLAAEATWARGRSAGPPGAGGARPDPGFLPRPPYRLYLADIELYEPSASEAAVFDTARRQARRAAGPAGRYFIDSYRLGTGDEPFRRGDVLVQVFEFDEERWVTPPVVVFSDPLPVPRGRSAIQLVRGRNDLEERPAAEVAAAIRTVGVDSRLNHPRWLRSPAARRALLGVWELADPD
jgi:hypothetical protein